MKKTEQDDTNKQVTKASASVQGDEFVGYVEFLQEVKARVQNAQVRAALAVNHELVLLYWGIGAEISQRMRQNLWGTKVVDRLADDLKKEFPSMQGFSLRNLRYMRTFAEAWEGAIVQQPVGQPTSKEKHASIVQEVSAQSTSTEPPAILQQVVAKLPWGHNILLLEKLTLREERLWYAQQTIENGWSRNVLVHQIESKLYQRQGKAVTNFERALPSPQSDLASQLLKDPYNFDFLTLGKDAHERDLEQGLLDHIRKFLLELGAGFAFLGSQYHLEFDDEDYYLDLLFYHVKLRCYVVIELKSGKFLPEYAGKMNFYLAVVDDTLRHEGDAPSIGLILCKEKKSVTVEYALRGMQTPIGVSGYQITESLPEELKDSLPTVEQLEAELADKEDTLTESGKDE
jgi:predicted nuclease of restriction endonuclease-like (RecB) superfamily